MKKIKRSVVRLFAMAVVSLSIYGCIFVKGEAVENSKYISKDDLSPEEEKAIADKIASMSLHEKVCQMIVCYPEQLAGVENVTEVNETMEQMFELLPVGGVILDKSNMKSKSQVSGFISDMQALSDTKLLTMCDEEGGRVARLSRSVGTASFLPMLSYESAGTPRACLNASVIASDMSALGFNLDLAPVADVWSNPANNVIGDRAYSRDFDTACELIPAAVAGFHDGGVACTLKHFPGHGDTYEDSHEQLPVIYKSLEDLQMGEFKPFIAGINAGADCVMTAHILAPNVDAVPASLSRVFVTGILREAMGFEGVIMTDSLQMKALTDNYTPVEISVYAVNAGNDILLLPTDPAGAAAAVEAAVMNGVFSEERIDESVYRILRLKARISGTD
ncbi:MAG: glycoside hydrolase family 3 protein [Lachnospiraceae bacterium]|nr:glycoside hydrolase family 3 protein [Lachnospiraceae bacterium]